MRLAPSTTLAPCREAFYGGLDGDGVRMGFAERRRISGFRMIVGVAVDGLADGGQRGTADPAAAGVLALGKLVPIDPTERVLDVDETLLGNSGKVPIVSCRRDVPEVL
jgi:hypothetical protein